MDEKTYYKVVYKVWENEKPVKEFLQEKNDFNALKHVVINNAVSVQKLENNNKYYFIYLKWTCRKKYHLKKFIFRKFTFAFW